MKKISTEDWGLFLLHYYKDKETRPKKINYSSLEAKYRYGIGYAGRYHVDYKEERVYISDAAYDTRKYGEATPRSSIKEIYESYEESLISNIF